MSEKHVQTVVCQQIKKSKQLYTFCVTWSDGSKQEIQRRYTDMFDFQKELKANYSNVKIPEMKSGKWFTGWRSKKEEKKREVDEFFQKLLPLPVTNGPAFLKFFDCNVQSDKNCNSIISDENKETVVNKDSLSSKSSNEMVVYESVSEPYSYLQIKPAAVEVFDEKNEDAKKNDGKELNQTYWAVTSYEKRSSGEVDLREGSLVTVLQRQLSGWWFVHVDDTKEEGWAPGTCLLPQDRDCLAGYAIKGTAAVFVTNSDYNAVKQDELSFKKGEKVEVLETALDGWWKVRCNDKVGLVAGTFLEPGNKKKRNSIYDQANIYKKRNPPPRRSEDDTYDDLYAKVDLYKKNNRPNTTTVKPVANPEDSDSEPVYSEVDPAPDTASPTNKEPNCEPQKKEPCVHLCEDQPAASASGHRYVNVTLQVQNDIERQSQDHIRTDKKYFVVLPERSLTIKHSLILPGDIVVSTCESVVNKSLLCKLHRPASGETVSEKEEWISREHLLPYDISSNNPGHRKNLSLDHSIAPDNPAQSKASVKQKQSTGSLDSAVGTISKSDASKFVGPSHPGKQQKMVNSPCGYLPAPGESLVNLPLNTRDPNEPKPCPPAPQREKHSDDGPVSPHKIKQGITLQNSDPIKPSKPDLPGRSVSNKPVDSGPQSMREAKQKEQSNSEFDNANVSTTSASSNQNVQTKQPVERFARSQTQAGPNMPKNIIERTPPATKQTSDSVGRMRYSKICKIDRNESETILSTRANPQDYILRESTTKVGSYAFSVLSEDGIHHFPIAATPEGKYYIGQYNFDTLDDVVAYYKTHPLFTNAYGNDVMLGTQFEMQ